MVDIRLFFNQLLPADCLLCHSKLEPEEIRQSAPFCRYCWSGLPWLGPHCQRCAAPLPEGDELVCGQCQQQPPPWQRAHAIFKYEQPVSTLILQCKYQQRLFIATKLGQMWWAQLNRQALLDSSDIIVPVPLHWRRQWQRGYNQVVELLRPAAGGLRILPHCLQRVRHTQSQTGMDRKSRISNLRHAFRCHTGSVDNQRVLLVDDVMTTGATLQAASHCLLDAGARQVEVMILARTVKQ